MDAAGQGITVAVILCAGQGTRMGVAQNKVLLPLAGKPLLVYALEAFASAPGVAEILVVAHPNEVDQITSTIVLPLGLPMPMTVIPGGTSRHQSEFCALTVLRQRISAGSIDLVVVHDGARPFVAQADIARLLAVAHATGGALLATRVGAGERIAVVGDDTTLAADYSAEHLWRAQTPQAFAARPLLAAYDAALAAGFEGTDTAASFERAGHAVRVVAGSPANIKVTTPEDLVVAADLVRQLAVHTAGPPGASYTGYASSPHEGVRRMPLLADEHYARQLDQSDPLAALRDRFFLIPNTIYMDGNSLGLLSHDAETCILESVAQWKTLGINGWSQAEPPWYFMGEDLGRLMGPLVGAEPVEVVATGTTTLNIHSLVATFYRRKGKRAKIVCCDLDFPSDRYALASELELHGRDPATDLIAVPCRADGFVAEDDIIAAFTNEVALVMLPGVLYRSGQLLDMARLTAAAHARGILIGFDCAHSVGALPHQFDAWDVDFAVWCSYKYLNSGPGSVGALYVNRRHFDRLPAIRGWWGSDKQRQFDMAPDFTPAGNAGSWQISTNPLFGAAALRGSLQIFGEVGIDAIRAKSLALTDYLIALLDELAEAPYHYTVGTPRDHARRGGHVAADHPEGARIAKALKARGVIPDFRPPYSIRLAPIALYSTFHDVWQTVQHLKAIVDTKEYEQFPQGRDLIA